MINLLACFLLTAELRVRSFFLPESRNPRRSSAWTLLIEAWRHYARLSWTLEPRPAPVNLCCWQNKAPQASSWTVPGQWSGHVCRNGVSIYTIFHSTIMGIFFFFGRKDLMYRRYPRIGIRISTSKYFSCYSIYHFKLTFFPPLAIPENLKFYLFKVHDLMSWCTYTSWNSTVKVMNRPILSHRPLFARGENT